MLHRQVAAISLIIAVLAGAAAAVSVSQQKPVEEVPVIIEYAEPPRTLEDATARAHAIVRARVVGSQFRQRRVRPDVPPDVNTAYALKALDVLKRDPQLPIPTEVLREGGDRETDQGILRYVEEGFPAFHPGDEYLLFLYWNENLAAYQMIFGVDGAYRITSDNRVHGLGRSVLARQHTGRDAREVANRIREIATGRRDK
jgi:hypothetical protein